jgi:hypothetical protein
MFGFGTYSIVGLILLVLFIIFLVDIISRPMPIEKKLLWILIVLLVPVIGLILYFLIGRGS